MSDENLEIFRRNSVKFSLSKITVLEYMERKSDFIKNDARWDYMG